MQWFYAEDILARLGLDPNNTYAPISRLCAALGLKQSAEERRIKGHSLLSSGAKRLEIENEEGETERQLCLKIELLPLWLTSLDARQVAEPGERARLELFQRECASTLWQGFRPQGFGLGDELLPQRHQQTTAEQAYAGQAAMATMARHQMLIERQLDTPPDDDSQGGDPWAERARAIDDQTAARLAQTVRRVAQGMAERSRRNEYYGVYSGLYRNFSISSYRRMPPARLHEALEWLERWYGDMMGEPEPPPDI
jgi:P22_AR N-terminal domain